MGIIDGFIKSLAFKKLTYDSAFIVELLKRTSSKTLLDGYSNNKTDLLSLIHRLRGELVKITDEFPQSANKDHIERTIESIARHVNAEEGVFVDLGAAYGEVSMAFYERFPNNEFHLFEPLDESYKICIEKFTGLNKVTVHKKAVGNENVETVIHKSKSSTSSSLLQFSDNLSNDFFKERLKYEEDEKIEVVRVDDYLKTQKPIWLMKLDVQGFEIPALQGAENTLKQTRFVLCEMMNHDNYVGAPQYYDIDNYLRSKGFKLADMAPGLRRNGKIYEFDCLYYNSNLLNL